MEKTYALVNKDGLIENIVHWDGEPYSEIESEEFSKFQGKKVKVKISNGWQPPEGLTAIQIDNAHIGGTYLNGKYTPPLSKG